MSFIDDASEPGEVVVVRITPAAPGIALVLSLLALSGAAEARPAGRVWRIGILAAQSPSASSDRIGAFRQGLVDLGYTAGKNIAIEYRYADGRLERLASVNK